MTRADLSDSNGLHLRHLRHYAMIGDPTLGDAIPDRVIHRSHRIELKGESLRKRQALAATESLTNAREK
jgi:DNA replication protein DnaC